MPDFSCAHLEDADFTGHTLFPGLLSFRRVYSPSDITKSGWFHTTPDWVKDKAKETGKDVDFSPLHMRPPKFVKAILNGANFESIAFFDFYKGGSMAVLKTHMNASLGVKSGDFTLLKGYMDNDVFRRIDERESNDYSWDQSLPLIRKFQIGIRAAFYAAEYQQAKLPRKLKELLNASTPSHLDYETAFGSQGVAEPDLNCNTKAR